MSKQGKKGKRKGEARGYRFKASMSKSDKAKVLRIIDRGIKAQTPAREIKAQLRYRGLGYRDTNLYHDIRRRKAEYRPIMTTDHKIAGYYRMNKTARKASLKWFDKIFESFRRDNKLTAKQVNKIWERARAMSYKNLSEAEIDHCEAIIEYYEGM